MKKRTLFLLALVMLPAVGFAQTDSSIAPTRPQAVAKGLVKRSMEPAAVPADYPVRTFALHRLNTDAASRLLGPYVQPAGGVYAGATSHEITVRASAAVLARVDSILREEDKPARTIALRFELILASDSAFRDAATADIDAALRDLFRFKGYRLLAQGTVISNEYESFSLTLGGPDMQYGVDGRVEGTTDGKGALPLNVSLHRRLGGHELPQAVLYTGVTVPLGQTVVLGSAARDREDGALILTVRPVLQAKP